MTLEMIEQMILSVGATSAVAVALMAIITATMNWDGSEQGWVKLYNVIGGLFLFAFLVTLVLYVLLQGAKVGV